MTGPDQVHSWVDTTTTRSVSGAVERWATCQCGYRTPPANLSFSALQDAMIRHIDERNLVALCIAAADQANPRRAEDLCKAVRIWYQDMGHGAGGCFHVVLDDGNTEAVFRRGCLNGYLAVGWVGDPDDDPGREAVLALGLALLSFTEDDLDGLYGPGGDWWGMRAPAGSVRPEPEDGW